MSRGRCSSAAAGGRGARWGCRRGRRARGRGRNHRIRRPGPGGHGAHRGMRSGARGTKPGDPLEPGDALGAPGDAVVAVAAGSCHRRSWRAEGRVRASGRAGWNRMPGPAGGWASASESAGWAPARSGGPAGRARASTAGVRRAAVRAGRAEAPGSESSAQGAREACRFAGRAIAVWRQFGAASQALGHGGMKGRMTGGRKKRGSLPVRSWPLLRCPSPGARHLVRTPRSAVVTGSVARAPPRDSPDSGGFGQDSARLASPEVSIRGADTS